MQFKEKVVQKVVCEKQPLAHPVGSVQAVCSGSAGMFAVLIAFIGYTAFNAKGQDVPWSTVSLIYLVPAFAAAVALGLVPWIATKPHKIPEIESSIRNARTTFLFGGACTVFAMSAFIVIDYIGYHV